MPEPTTRSEYIAGLRALADLLEQHDELELPFTGSGNSLNVIPVADQREQVAAWARALPGLVRKSVRDGYFDLTGNLHGLRIAVICDRDQVCTRVVTGTREVTTSEPIISGHRDVTETVEDVEWVCEPLLAEAVSE